jgi:murein tripeptide amidase MpaA
MSSTTCISISDAFDGANIEMKEQKDDNTILLHIKPDVYTELEQKKHSQYFCFRSTLSGLAEQTRETSTVTYLIENADTVSYPQAWKGSTVFYTTNVGDADSWKRKLDTTYDEHGNLSWTHNHDRNGAVYFSYFPPYSYARHMDLVAKCTDSEHARVETLGQTLQGREMECVQIGTGKTVCWIIHRQHPGESMAEYYAEGLLTRLLGLGLGLELETNGRTDATVRQVLEQYTFYIVPNMCPDGSVLGHLRTNAAGANLNREWASAPDYEAPTLERSPEVYGVLNKMKETGVDLFLDIHGDEELPFNFLSGAESTVNWGPRLESLHGAFAAAYERSNPDMQRRVGYTPGKPPGRTNVATNAVANRFDCLALTLEMPFKDCLSNPDPEYGWSPNRSRILGASVVEALAYVQPYLRASGEFWTELPAEDAYVRPSHDYDLADYEETAARQRNSSEP